MPIDPWAATVAQEFTAQEPNTFRRLAQILAANKREMFDIRASVLANVSDVVADLRAKQADLEAQNVQILALIADTVRGAQAGTWVLNFPVTTTLTAVITRTIAVPAGFTNALVFASAHVFAQNTTAAPDYLYAAAQIGPVVGPAEIPTVGSAGAFITAAASSSTSFTGLTGGTITVATMVKSLTAAWTAMASNIASLDVIAIFSR